MHCSTLLGVLTLAACSLFPGIKCWAAGGTSIVATPGQETTPDEGWPEGTAALVNDAARTDGWNPWFTEWPNDVEHFAYDIKSVEDLNRLLEKLGQIKSDVREVRLSYFKEPDGLGWVTRLDEGNGVAVLFSIGDQSQIDTWYQHVRKPFGRIEFESTPVAVPPTLTLFVGNDAIDLSQLKIPENVDVVAASVPGPFSDWKMKREPRLQDETPKQPVVNQPELAPELQRAKDLIEAFLEARAKARK